MIEIKFLERWRDKLNEINKARAVKYIRRYPKKTGKGYNYVYQDSWKHPFKALLECFGIKQKKIDDNYAKHDIKKDFGADKQTFAAHVLEYFTNKIKWDTLFSKKEARDKYKEPVQQKAVQERAKAKSVAESVAKKPDNDKMIVNRSLMRKVWSIYSVEGQRIEAAESASKQKAATKEGVFTDNKESVTGSKGWLENYYKDSVGGMTIQDVKDGKAHIIDLTQNKESEAEKHANRSNAMKGNKNAEKDGVDTDIENGGNANEGNNIDTQQRGVSASVEDVRTGRGKDASNQNVSSPENGGNGSQPVFRTDQLGRGLGDADGDVNRGRGRITKGQARKIREQCREILKKSDSDITEADKQVLSQYVGAGGTDEEGISNNGVLYEFYTPRNVISKVWQLVDKYNPRQDKTVIEPSSGIGRFAEGRSEKFTMFELEEDSARIAHILHPDAEIVQGAFQEHFMKQKQGRFTKNFEQYDVAVGNPPYGAYTGKYKGLGEGKDFKRYESYFMARTLDTVKDGGIMAMVVPSGFLDGGSAYGRDLEKIAGKAELLEAWRLPNGTFESTDVGTDIVVFRKGKGTTVEALKSYFDTNPDHIAGEQSIRIGRFGEETYIKPKDGETFESAVANIDVGHTIVEKQIEAVSKNVTAQPEAKKAKKITDKTKFGDFVETEKGTGLVVGYLHGKNRKITGVVVNIDGKSEKIAFADVDSSHTHLSDAMKGNKNAAGKHDYPIDPKAQLLDAEAFNKKYGKNIDPQDLPIWKVTDKFGNVDITKLTPEQKKYVEHSEHFVKDGQVYTNVVNYASGNIRQKLRELDESDPQYTLKKSLLEAVCPKEKGFLRTWKETEIDENGNKVEVEKSDGFTLSPITDWTREYVMKDGGNLISGFRAWVLNGRRNYDPSDSPVAREEIPPELSWSDIDKFIEKQELRLDRGEAGTDDKKSKERYRERKMQLRRDTAIKLFNRYLTEGLSLEEQSALIEAWNDKANSFVNPDYTKIPIFVDGMCTHKGSKEFNLSEQQMKGISMLTNKGTGLLAYDVGVGKTACGIVATVNQIQTGRAKKPLICVPKAVYTNWIKSIHQFFPNMKVNELGNLSKHYWQEGMKIDDGTISVCTYEGLENIGFNDQEEAEIQEDVEFGALESNSEGKSKRAKASESEKQAELVGEMGRTRDGGVQFSELGFDHITVDEVHNFRNLFKMPRHMNKNGKNEQGESNEFDGLGSGGDPADRAKKLFAITQLIQRHNDGRNTFLFSATPFQNSPTEVYSILSYMARDKLKEMGFYSLEQFVSNFCKVQREYVVKANRVTDAPVVKGFENLSELQGLLVSYMDKVDGEEAGVVRPYKRPHAPELELSDLQKAIMNECSAYIEKQEQTPKKERDDGYMFRAMNAMKNCALSPVLVDPSFIPEGYDVPPASEFVESSPKLKFTCDSIIAQYKQNKKNGQIMYMPSGVEQFPQVRNYLVKHGMPKEAIALIKGAATTDKALEERDETFKDFNNPDGKCKVIIGSSTIKEGCNLQGNTTTIYCTQLDWNPTDVQQLWGRGWRQGNRQGIVHCITPLMHDSLDPMIYQKHDEKSSRTNDLYSYKGDAMNAQDVNPEELKFSLIKDPKKRADLQVMEFTEKNKSDQKMYGQLIDVLHKQIETAFKSDEEIAENAKNGLDWKFEGVDAEKKKITEYEQNIKDLKEKLALFKKDYKGKEDSFSHENREALGKYDAAGGTIRWGWRNGRSGYEEALHDFDLFITGQEEGIARSKFFIKTYNKNLKKLTDARESCRSYLASKNMHSQKDCEEKIQDYVRLMDEARKNIDRAKDMRAQFLQEAIAYNEANKKNIFSVDELVKLNVESIMNDLHPMDDEWKAKIKAENDKRFGSGVKKSWCYFDKNGNLFFRKSAFSRIA